MADISGANPAFVPTASSQEVVSTKGFNRGEVVLLGYVEDISSKRGIRYVNFEATEPYTHRAMIDVEGDEGREDDDSLTADLGPFESGMVIVRATIRDGELFATPSQFSFAGESA